MNRPLFLLLVILTFHLAAARYGIHITSRVPNKPSPLRVRCQSKDDDFGMHTLYEGQEFKWYFNRGLTTLYFCHFYWGSKDKVFDVFNVTTTDDGYCNRTYGDAIECLWEARPDGFYVNNWERPWNKVNDWS
ncbi:hypothetical protein Vadar_023511 [Vaccinium darrowii]|uniref:Uncharacterized protein n=1 Tax=Vaccinium darrowii TaxID=229202 RepID=A0ACB7XU06_9ERIC|nr:hypothetical protein Vadar_023511 [Vaccinium darrowii]